MKAIQAERRKAIPVRSRTLLCNLDPDSDEDFDLDLPIVIAIKKYFKHHLDTLHSIGDLRVL